MSGRLRPSPRSAPRKRYLEGRERIVRDLGDGRVVILRTHALLTVGETIAEAFLVMARIETACRYLEDVLSCGRCAAAAPAPSRRGC